jgi:periplasmic divalent cation tolerance protein
MNFHIVYITASSREEAEKISRVLLEERLIACANIFDPVTSLYWWKGEIRKDAEALLIAKTKESLVDQLIERVKALHSYECPCIVSFPLAKGNPDFLKWISEETL